MKRKPHQELLDLPYTEERVDISDPTKRTARNLVLGLCRLSGMTIGQLVFFTGLDRCHLHREIKKLLDEHVLESRLMDVKTRVYLPKTYWGIRRPPDYIEERLL